MKWIQRNMAALLVAGALSLGLVGPAAAQVQDGLVNVAVGNITILEDVNVGVAAQVAANICNVAVGPVAVLARQVDRTGVERNVCMSANGPVDITQNT